MTLLVAFAGKPWAGRLWPEAIVPADHRFARFGRDDAKHHPFRTGSHHFGCLTTDFTAASERSAEVAEDLANSLARHALFAASEADRLICRQFAA